jgi:transposase-like protein
MSKDTVIGFSSQEQFTDALTDLLRSGARKLIEQAIEAELAGFMEQFTGRMLADGKAAVTRSGHHPERMIQTGIGPVPVKIPKVRSRDETPVSFRSALVPPYVRKTASLEAALPWLYLKGVSTGEMDEALKVLVGPQASGLSASTVSRLKQLWGEDYRIWRKEPLDKDRWVYIWADGIYSGLRSADTKLCALVVIGVNDLGHKRFLAIEDGVRESEQSWREVLLSLKARGMNAPKLAIGDGAMGFWSAMDKVYPQTRHQRCWMHKTGNVLNCMPKSVQPRVKRALHEIWQAETKDDANKAFDLFVESYEAKYPKATEKLEKDRTELLAFYDFPAVHWQSLRTTNPF